MVENKGIFSLPDIFTTTNIDCYIDYCKKPNRAWDLLEKPMWRMILGTYGGLSKGTVLDLGAGTGKLCEVLIENGVSVEKLVTLEPNRRLCMELKYKGIVLNVIGSTLDLKHRFFKNIGFDMITANMVVNHLTTPEYIDFVKKTRNIIFEGGSLIYTVPCPTSKAIKHGFYYTDNKKVVSEKAPWGGEVKYHHRSMEFQEEILKKNGFETNCILAGYESFLSEDELKLIEWREGKYRGALKGYKRLMIEAIKNS